MSMSSQASKLAEDMQKCSRYQSLLFRKTEIDMEISRRKKNISNLTEEVAKLSWEVEKAKLEEKWVISRPGREKSPADETLRLCQQLEENPDHLESVLQDLCLHQSKVTSQVSELKEQLAALATRRP